VIFGIALVLEAIAACRDRASDLIEVTKVSGCTYFGIGASCIHA
jgi:hypothetical protein